MKTQSLLNFSLLLLQLGVIPWSACQNSQPYCYKNITETSYKVVTKTRLKNVSSKNFFKKITFKKDTQAEIYEEQEPVYTIKLERSCCEGYKQSELELCEPQCVKNGCPKNAMCVEPEVCECLKGYLSNRSTHDGQLICEPICEQPCPENSVCIAPNECACRHGYQCKTFCASGCPYEGECVAPNVCSCQEGYIAENGTCIPICSLGDQCRNGKCVAKDLCICNPGLYWNVNTSKCEFDDSYPTNQYFNSIEPQQSTDVSMAVEADTQASKDDIVDRNQVFDEIAETITFSTTDEYYSSTTASLSSLKSIETDINCNERPCQDNAVCVENGTCVCIEGFKLSLTECLPVAEYDQLENFRTESNKFFTIVFLATGVPIILGIVLLLAYYFKKLRCNKTGKLDVEGKDLTCAYSNRETEKSLI